MGKKNRKRYLKYKANLRKWKSYGVYFASTCEICGAEKFFYERYDAICCVSCDVWLEEKCSDPDCPYCSVRPIVPSEAFLMESRGDGRAKEWRRNNYQHKNDGRIRHEVKRKKYSLIKQKKLGD